MLNLDNLTIIEPFDEKIKRYSRPWAYIFI